MIYRTDIEHGDVYQPLQWKLFGGNKQRIPLTSEEELREYLMSHADEDFDLVPGQLFNREVQGEDARSFDPHGDHIRCGSVRFDSQLKKIITK
jgi:hypothetical protein